MLIKFDDLNYDYTIYRCAVCKGEFEFPSEDAEYCAYCGCGGEVREGHINERYEQAKELRPCCKFEIEITDEGRPSIRVVPHKEAADIYKGLRTLWGSVNMALIRSRPLPLP